MKREITTLLSDALVSLGVPFPTPFVERPTDVTHGDYGTSAALMYAKTLGKSPQDLARQIAEYVEKNKPDFIERVSVAGPGFINFTLSPSGVKKVLFEAQNIFKGTTIRKGEKINIEFVSANPTGDLHIGHARNAFFGDALARVLSWSGAEVTREFYINDSRDSKQIEELGKTFLGKGESYKTEKLLSLIEGKTPRSEDSREAGIELAELIQENNKRFLLAKAGVLFDMWYSEDVRIRNSGLADKMIDHLKEKNFVYENEGALWLKTTEYGDDEDRVLVRSDGTKTYFVSDIAYHADKFSRGYTSVFNVWGADHHGHVKRMKAVSKMLGWNGEFDIFITQLVTIKEGGELKKMSKRAGNVVLFEDLVDEFGIDVVRWFFTTTALGTHMEFDEALAKDASEKNPVFYTQYAHARISSIEEKLHDLSSDNTTIDDALESPSGRALALRISEYGEIMSLVSSTYELHRIPIFAYELARSINHFYRDVKIISDDAHYAGGKELISIARTALENTLGLIGVSAPKEM